VAAFDGGAITSDAGGLLLGAADQAVGLIDRFARCFRDSRSEELIEHTVATMVGQRIFGIALGYEDVVDHDELRRDPIMAVLAGKLTARRKNCAPVAGKSTLNRLELGTDKPTAYHKIGHDPQAIADFVDLFLKAHRRAPRQIILDLDATDDPLHGHQEGRFFHGYYDCYCYLPLYIFCGRHLLAAKLRRSNIDARAGAVEEVARIVAQIRACWPAVRILLRADSGFAREGLMRWCELNRVDYLFGLARNARLTAAIAAELEAARQHSERTGRPARRFKDFTGSTLDSWSRERRVVAKAEWTGGGANPRFVVTSLSRAEHRARPLYEKVYCARGEMENSYQGVPARPVRRPHLGNHDARQSAAAVVRRNGLCAGLQLAPHRASAHPVRPGQLWHHPPQTVQNRRAGAGQCAPHQARHGRGLPVPKRVRSRPFAADRHRALTAQKCCSA
jgi:Transposase DDE domain group 1